MNILITGSTGFLGKVIIEENQKFQLYTLNRTSGDYIFDLSNTIPNFDFTFDLIIHNAGKAHFIPKTKVESNNFFDINTKGTENLLKGLENKLPKQFVFISTVSVYGVITGELLNENTKLNAKDPYGLSKINAEKLIIEWCQRHNVICTILRLPLVVGENPPGNLGSMIRAIKSGFYMNIAGGHAKKSMVLAVDVAKFITIVSKFGGIYNLTDGIHHTMYELSKSYSLKYKKKIPYNIPFFVAKVLALFGDKIVKNFPFNSNKLKKIVSNLTFDDTKARNSIGWNPKNAINHL
jgi:nucleoside-diphosphate-sugar epimerase